MAAHAPLESGVLRRCSCASHGISTSSSGTPIPDSATSSRSRSSRRLRSISSPGWPGLGRTGGRDRDVRGDAAVRSAFDARGVQLRSHARSRVLGRRGAGVDSHPSCSTGAFSGRRAAAKPRRRVRRACGGRCGVFLYMSAARYAARLRRGVRRACGGGCGSRARRGKSKFYAFGL